MPSERDKARENPYQAPELMRLPIMSLAKVRRWLGLATGLVVVCVMLWTITILEILTVPVKSFAWHYSVIAVSATGGLVALLIALGLCVFGIINGVGRLKNLI